MRIRAHTSRWVCLCILYGLLLVLSACGEEPGAQTTPFAPTPTMFNLNVYTGAGYSIAYPQEWNIQKSSDGAFSATDQRGTAYITIRVLANSNGIVAPEVQIQHSLKTFESSVKSYKVLDGPKSTTVGGDEWRQEMVVGDAGSLGQVQYVVLADNHAATPPKSGQSIVLVYGTARQQFEQKNRDIFQKMLHTFKFL